MLTSYTHVDYLADVARLAETILEPSKFVLARVKRHLANRHSCSDCCHEADTESFPEAERALREAENTYIEMRYPGQNVGSMKLKHGSPIGVISAYLSGKHLAARRREADRDACGPLSPWASGDAEPDDEGSLIILTGRQADE